MPLETSAGYHVDSDNGAKQLFGVPRTLPGQSLVNVSLTPLLGHVSLVLRVVTTEANAAECVATWASWLHRKPSIEPAVQQEERRHVVRVDPVGGSGSWRVEDGSTA